MVLFGGSFLAPPQEIHTIILNYAELSLILKQLQAEGKLSIVPPYYLITNQ